MGARVAYPGLRHHKQHELLGKLRNANYGYGGMLTVDFGSQQVPRSVSPGPALKLVTSSHADAYAQHTSRPDMLWIGRLSGHLKACSGMSAPSCDAGCGALHGACPEHLRFWADGSEPRLL